MSLAGHVIPGTFFILYGSAWSTLSIWTHLTSKKQAKKSGCFSEKRGISNSELERRSWLPLCICANFPLEPILKIVLPALAIFIEAFLDYRNEGGEKHVIWRVYKVYDQHGYVRDQGKLHHITMHCGFVLSGIVDIMVMFIRFPAYTSKLFLSLAFSIEFILFYLHTAGRDELNIEIHSILVFIIFFCLIFSLLRLVTSSNLIINLGFASGLFLQGSWLIQAGYFLFSSFLSHRRAKSVAGEHHDHHGLLMFFGEAFAWHIFFVAIGQLVLWVVLSLLVNGCVLRRASSRDVDIEECRNLMTAHGNGICSQDEEMVEFRQKTQL